MENSDLRRIFNKDDILLREFKVYDTRYGIKVGVGGVGE